MLTNPDSNSGDNQHMSRIHRLFQTLQSLRRLSPPVTAAVLAQDLGVSLRTVYRDVEELRGLGAVIDGTAGFGYVLTEDPSLPPLTFSDEEIEALVLGLREVREIADPALAEAADNALLKLRARLAPGQSRRLEHAVLTAKRFHARPEIGIDTRRLRQAAWDEMAVDIDYSDAADRVTQRRVYPLSIVYFDTTLCLMAWCCLREAFRAFRLDRIRRLEVSAESFRPRRIPLLRDCLRETFADQGPRCS